MIKKILSIAIIIFILFPLGFNFVNAIDLNQEYNKYSEILQNQTKEELQAELKIFKLQKSLVSGFEKSYNELSNNVDNYIKEINTYQNSDISSKGNSYINFIGSSTPALNNFIPGLYQGQEEDILNINSKYYSNYKKHSFLNKNLTQANDKGNLDIKFLNNNLLLKYNIDSITKNKDLYLNIKDLYIKQKIKYSDVFHMLNPSITNQKELDNEIEPLISTIKKINRFGIKSKNKTIKITDNIFDKNQKKFEQIKALNKFYEEYKNSIKKDRIQKIIDLLKNEKLIYIYKSDKKGHYKFFYDIKLAYKINQLAGNKILPILTFDQFTEIEKRRLNVITELNDGSFKYLYLQKDKKTKKIKDAIYFIFDESVISTGLIKLDDNIVFLNRNVLKIRGEKFKGYLSLENNEYKTKFEIINNRDNSKLEVAGYLKENLEGGVIETKFIQNKNNEVLNSKLMFLKDKEDNIKININLFLKNFTNNKNLYLNKKGIIDLNLNYLLKNNEVKAKFIINDSSMLPINIKGTITSNIKINKNKVKISIPKNVDLEYNSLDNFKKIFE